MASRTKRGIAVVGALALLGCVLYLGLASQRDGSLSVWYALASAIAAPAASLILGYAAAHKFLPWRDLVLPLLISYGALAVNWVFNLVRWPFLRNATVVTVVSAVLAVATLIALASSRPSSRWLNGSSRIAVWATAGVLAGIASFGAWTLASPARLEVEALVAKPGDPWRNELTVQSGDVVAVLISFRNAGRGIADNMVVGDNLPPWCEVIEDTTTLTNSKYPEQLGLPDGVTTGGVRVGDYGPGSNGHVKFKVRISRDAPPGRHRLQNVGIAKADQTLETWDTSFMVLK